jgi:hypothetical protein
MQGSFLGRIVAETENDGATLHSEGRENSCDMFRDDCCRRREPFQGLFMSILVFVVGISVALIS